MKRKLSGKILYSFLYLIIGSAVFFTSLTFRPLIGQPLLLMLQLLIIAILSFAYVLLSRKEEIEQKELVYCFLAAAVALTILTLFQAESIGITADTPRGVALAKLFDSVIIVAVLLVLLKLAGFEFKSIYITRGRLVAGLITGMVTFVVMAFLAVTKSGNEKSLEIISRFLPWVILFIFSNAFMEELLFRGIFLKRMITVIGAPASILVTSVVFALAHMQVIYRDPSAIAGFVVTVFVLALLWGTAMHKTESIIAPVLFHAGADLVILLDIYNSLGAAV
ncbi:MAG: CPBP family intramembrane metalloprotease [Candidatus Latescibacteria bacterium]|nr:CPBP family intramembrane metalloprotease [bacterium]MBD3422869.1 CPBP family intramembrane metalloprotease [Candidatus Latescibacterota bacterium]